MFADVTIETVFSLAADGIWRKERGIIPSVDPLSFEMQQPPKAKTNSFCECSICHKLFQNSRSLKRHYTEKHAMNSLTKFHCPNCDKSYVHKKHLNHHMKHECGDVPKFVCPYCDHSTKYRVALNTHIKNQHLKKFKM